jgi:hypothetical protein
MAPYQINQPSAAGTGIGKDKKAGHKKSPGNKGRVSGAEHVPNDVHPGLFPLREVERERTKSNSSVAIIDPIALL